MMTLMGRPDYFGMLVAVLLEERVGERVSIGQMIEAATINEAYLMLCDDSRI